MKGCNWILSVLKGFDQYKGCSNGQKRFGLGEGSAAYHDCSG